MFWRWTFFVANTKAKTEKEKRFIDNHLTPSNRQTFYRCLFWFQQNKYDQQTPRLDDDEKKFRHVLFLIVPKHLDSLSFHIPSPLDDGTSKTAQNDFKKKKILFVSLTLVAHLTEFLVVLG